MNIEPLPEDKINKITSEKLSRVLLSFFKDAQAKSRQKPELYIPRIKILNILFRLCPIPDSEVSELPHQKDKIDWIIENRSIFAANFFEAIALLQRRGLIMPEITISQGTNVVGGVRIHPPKFLLTSVGLKSKIVDEIILLVDDAEEIIQSIRNEVDLDEMVADFYRESIRAWQARLLLSSCICLGAASECAISELAHSLVYSDYSQQNESDMEKWLKDRSMKNKINTLCGWIRVVKSEFPNEACFIDLQSKLEHLAHWYRITRNEAGHADKETILPTQDEIELSIHMFRRYIISIFQVINLLCEESS